MTSQFTLAYMENGKKQRDGYKFLTVSEMTQ
jgi:hypothetical protein